MDTEFSDVAASNLYFGIMSFELNYYCVQWNYNKCCRPMSANANIMKD